MRTSVVWRILGGLDVRISRAWRLLGCWMCVISSSGWRRPRSISLLFHRKSRFMEAPQVFGPGGILKSAGCKEKRMFLQFCLQRPRFFAWSKLGVGAPPTELTKVSPGLQYCSIVQYTVYWLVFHTLCGSLAARCGGSPRASPHSAAARPGISDQRLALQRPVNRQVGLGAAGEQMCIFQLPGDPPGAICLILSTRGTLQRLAPQRPVSSRQLFVFKPNHILMVLSNLRC